MAVRGGWFAVVYDEGGYDHAGRYQNIEDLWTELGDRATTMMIDVPIGLREDSNKPRPCDAAAREKLKPVRHSSVFPAPVRAAVHQDSYEDAKQVQERKTDGSLGVPVVGDRGQGPFSLEDTHDRPQ